MRSNEQRLHLPSPDWLRNLAIHLIDDILNRLFFRDVVRTSTLFMDFQYTCRTIPKVGNTRGLESPTIGFIILTLDGFISFHIGTTLNVILDITSLKVCLNIDRLIHFLTKNFIQHFILKLPFTYPPYKIPYFFFYCSALRHL